MTQSPAPTQLATDRLILKPQVMADAPALLAMLADGEAMRFWHRPPVTRLAVVESLMEDQQQAMAQGHCRYWTAFEGGDPVGSLDLSLIADGAAELGFLLRRDRWGRGLATEAAGAVVTHGFGALGLSRLAAATIAGNGAARRILEKTGFTLRDTRLVRLAGGPVVDCRFYLCHKS